MTECDRWRLVAAVLACACVVLGLTLRSALVRAEGAESRVAHAMFDCLGVTPSDREHS